MLILTRKVDQALLFDLPDGTRIEVLVAAVEGRYVKLGITAPPDIVRVTRKEIATRAAGGDARD